MKTYALLASFLVCLGCGQGSSDVDEAFATDDPNSHEPADATVSNGSGGASGASFGGRTNIGGQAGQGGMNVSGTSGFAGSNAGSGGASNTGGSSGSGGSINTGGSAGQDGSAGNGGISNTGGMAGYGGFTTIDAGSPDGTTMDAGSNAGSGGAPNTGGSSGSGGSINTGGYAGSGGSINTGGTAGSGGSVSTDAGSDAGAGCPSTIPAAECDNGYGWAICDPQPLADIPRQSVIKAVDAPALYWYSADGTRWVFPNEQTFRSWFPWGEDCPMIYEMSLDDMVSIPIAGNMTIRPGTYLVKIVTDPKVYAISCGGILHWIESETVIRDIYGPGWQVWVIDIPDAFFVTYTIGTSIVTAADYDPDQELADTQTPEDEIACRN